MRVQGFELANTQSSPYSSGTCFVRFAVTNTLTAITKKAVFQVFTDESRSDLSQARLTALREILRAQGVSGMLLPRADVFQGEYLPACEDRLAFLTGFTGSAGFGIILHNKAALFVDGRYTVQAKSQVDKKAIKVVRLADISPDEWLARTARKGMKIGYDPALFTMRGLRRFERVAQDIGFALVPLAMDPVAAIWPDRPIPPATPVVDHAIAYAGEEAADKIARLQTKLSEARLDALLVSDCTNVNWMFNIRAGDVNHLPILRAFAVVPRAGKPQLFVDPKRLDPALATHLRGIAALIPPLGAPHDGTIEAEAALIALAKTGARIRLDEDTGAVRFSRAIESAGGRVDHGPDPVTVMKSAKNAIEIEGARQAHLMDGVAMARFLAWFDREIGRTQLTEIDTVVALEGFRRDNDRLLDISFPSISGAGQNAALPHYRVTDASNVPITSGMYLIDSGGQYREGTTDITRTIAVRTPTFAMRRMFTHVLKGMIALSLAVFPKGTSGAQLDALARAPLWEAGVDFDHGTGHGVGSYLSVHEGPQRFSKMGHQALLPGMILSNEPGYYREGKFGIRIENLLVVEQRIIKGAERKMLGFETLNFTPIDRRLIIKSMLTKRERDWLNAYHAAVLTKIGPQLDGDDRAWLEAACATL